VFAIRYLALLSLAVWLGGMVTLGQEIHWLAYVCGGLMLVCLVAIKLVGPPPRTFIPRVSLVVLMLAIAVYSGIPPRWTPAAIAPHILMSVNVLLGLVLLGWYVRE
jgi:hypothetical protein